MELSWISQVCPKSNGKERREGRGGTNVSLSQRPLGSPAATRSWGEAWSALSFRDPRRNQPCPHLASELGGKGFCFRHQLAALCYRSQRKPMFWLPL